MVNSAFAQGLGAFAVVLAVAFCACSTAPSPSPLAQAAITAANDRWQACGSVMHRYAKECQSMCPSSQEACALPKCPKYKPYYEASKTFPAYIVAAAFDGTPPKDLQEATEIGRFKRTVISLARREDPACEDADAEYKQLAEDVRVGAIAAALSPPPPTVITPPSTPTHTNCYPTGNGFSCSTY